MNLSLTLLGLLVTTQTARVTQVTITDHTSLPKGFASTDQPDPQTYYSVFMQSKTHWRVKRTGDAVEVTRYNPSSQPKRPSALNPKDYPGVIREKEYRAWAGPKVAQKVEDGWLYTVDVGEWGGGLYWFSTNWKTQKRLFDGNLKEPFTWNDGRYALGGLDHMGVTRGYLVKIERDPEKGWTAKKICDFDCEACFQEVDPQGNLLVVTAQGLYRVSKDGDREQLVKMRLPFYPESVVSTKNGTLYVGGTFYLLRLRPEGRGYRPEWMAPIDESPHG